MNARSLLGALALAATIACGADTTNPDNAATVVVAGAPTGMLLVGNTVQLTATPINSTGAVVPSVSLSWRTSDPAVAAVSGSGQVTAVGPGVATITASSGRAEGTAKIDVRAGGVVTTSGGTVSMLNGAVSLAIPAFALSQSTTVMLGYAASAPASARLVPATTFEVGPDGLVFSRYVPAAVRYDASRLPSGTTESSLQLYTVSGTAWTLVTGSTVDVTTHVVTGGISRSGVYGVASTPVSRIALSGAQVGGAMFVGQSGQLTATTYDANNTVLTGRVLTWTSSDNARVSVSATGLVTGVGSGTATITAAADGQTATTTITVLARPTADWSAATEWTTYQGNAAHTGYVPVNVDPSVFREMWTVAAATNALNAAVVGDGNVYVSNGAYFDTQLAKAYDVQTGVEKWSRDFGKIHSVDPPAFANGVVYLQTGGHQDSYLWGLDAQTGAVKFRTPYGNQWSRWYAPVVVGGTVYAAGGTYGGMYAFSATDGAQKWFASLNQYDLFTPAVDGGVVYAYTGAYNPMVTAADIATGKTIYEIKDPNFSWNGWSMSQAAVLDGSKMLFGVNGSRLVAFNLATRAIQYEIKSAFGGQLSFANNVVYVKNGSGVEARSASDGSMQWLWTPPEGQPSGPMIVTKNLLFVSTAANTYAVDLSTQRQIWAHPAGGALTLSPQGVLFIAQTTGKLTAIKAK